MKKFSLMLVLLASLVLFNSCDDDDDDDPIEPTNLVELAQTQDDLSILVDALVQTGLNETLQGDGPFTVFAPTNDAFQALLDSEDDWNSLSDIPNETLSSVLLYHVLSGKVMSGDLTEGYVPTLSQGPGGAGISLYIGTDGGASFNDADPVAVDIEASNGVVHKINKVLMPPSMTDIATSNSDLSTLLAALQVEGLSIDFLGELSNSDNYTVFAPTNDAFADLLGTNPDWNGLEDIPATLLNDVLAYHVVVGNNRSGDLQAGEVPTLLSDVNITVNLDGGVFIETINGQSVEVQVADIQTTNGVYHVINEVLLPIE